MLRILTPWDSQPQEAVGIDWDNPLTQGLCALYNPAAGLVNLVTGRAVTKSGNIEATVSSGKAWIMSATTNIVSDVVPALEQGPNKNLGFFMVGPIATTATNTASRIFHYGDSLFGAGYFVTGGSSGRTDASVGTGAVINLTGFVACFDGNASTRYGHNWRDGVGWEAYRGGTLLESFAQVSSRATPTTSNLWLLNRDTANRPIGIGSGFTLFGAWNRALSAQEHKSLSDNPWQLFAPRSIWVPVSVGGGSVTDLTIQDATHAQTADSLTLTTSTALTVDEALHAHTADNLTVSTTGAVNLVIDDATHAHTADALALTLDTTLAVADATHAHTADNLTISTSGAVNLTVDDATHGHTADSPTLTLGYVDLIVAEALHGHTADSPTLSVVEYTDLIIAEALHAHTVDNLTLTFPLGALSDAEFREMYDWVKELHRIHGLTSGVDLVVTPTSRTAGAISQTISEVGTTVTVTRP